MDILCVVSCRLAWATQNSKLDRLATVTTKNRSNQSSTKSVSLNSEQVQMRSVVS